MELRRALGLIVGLTSAACGDLGSETPDDPGGGDAAMPFVDGASPNPEGGMGQGGGDDAATNGAKVLRGTRIVSAPPAYAVMSEKYRYEPKTNAKANGLTLTSAPKGMTLSGSKVEWSPTADQKGKHRVVLSASGESGEKVEQEFDVQVATSTLVAEGEVPSDTGGLVVAAAPRSGKLQGAGIAVPPRALKSPTNLSVSALDSAPSMPNAQGAIQAVRFGPSGLVFDTPARVSLPLPDGVAHAKSRLSAYVYNPAGRWERARLIAADLENGLLTAEAQHFSIYAAVQSGIDVTAALARATDESACVGSLLARAEVASPLAEMELASVNNLSAALRARVASETASVLDLVRLPDFRGSLRVVQVFELMQKQGDLESVAEQRVVATTLFVAADGSAVVTHSDAFGNVLGSKQFPEPLLAAVEIEQRLRGAATTARFDEGMGGELGLGVRVHLAYYPGDASIDPVSVDDLGLALVDTTPVYGLGAAIADADCDGVGDAFDAIDDRLLPTIEAKPNAVASVFSGEALPLFARVARGTVQSSAWTVLAGSGATLEAVPAVADARNFRASLPGRYLVSFRAMVDGRALEHMFAIEVTEAPAMNTPPRCTPAKHVESGRVGEPVGLTAVASDDESATNALRIEWGLVNGVGADETLVPVPALLGSGARALFSPSAAGKYSVGCRAFDGQLRGPIGKVELSVVAAEQNRAPEIALSPLSKSVALNGEVTFRAWAKDPDGDSLSFEWQVEGASHADPQTKGGESSMLVIGTMGGVAHVTVTVSDGKAPPVRAEARLYVNDPSLVDADGDGWFAGGESPDCNDADARVHPGAKESCGDTVDYDCDGSIRLDDCDYDDFTIAQGDCDDGDPNRHPGGFELCDGIDNDCNQVVDDPFTVGANCVIGEGQCQAFGKIECSADGLSSLCAADAKLPSDEVCDRIDNDCDGVIDENDVCGETQPDGGTRTDGGVGDAGVGVPDASYPDAGGDYPDGSTGGDGGVTYPGDAGDGYPDASGQCEGREICGDGIDNDCNGDVDGNDKACMSDGGQCHNQGPEVCDDKVDNDCDGLIDKADPSCNGCKVSPEVCDDREDNDCDGLIDRDDPDCGANSVGESCVNPHGVKIGEWNDNMLDNHSNDIFTSCFDGVDYVYSFEVLEPGTYGVQYEGTGVHAYAFFQGSCSGTQQELKELSCKAGSGAYLEKGTYFLVIEGDESAYYGFMIQPILK